MDRRTVQEEEETMKKVNLYIAIGAHGPRRQHSIYGWILEQVLSNGASGGTLNKFGDCEDTTDREACLIALNEALGRFIEPCEIDIFISPEYEAEEFPTPWEQGWVDKWEAAGWKNSNGKEIVKAEAWQNAKNALQKHSYTFRGPKEKNSYKQWLTDEINKRQTERIRAFEEKQKAEATEKGKPAKA